MEPGTSFQAELEADLLDLDVSLSSARSNLAHTLNRAEAGYRGTLRVGLAGADRDFITNSIGHDRALMDLLGDGLIDFAGSAGDATHIRNVTLSQLTRDGLLSLSSSYGDAIDQLAQNNPNPWAQKDADQQAASHTKLTTRANSAVQFVSTTSAATRDSQNSQVAARTQKANVDFTNVTLQTMVWAEGGVEQAVAEAAADSALANTGGTQRASQIEITPDGSGERWTMTLSSFERYFVETNAPSSGVAGHFEGFLGQPFNGSTPPADKLIAPTQAQSLPNGQVAPSRAEQPIPNHTSFNTVAATVSIGAVVFAAGALGDDTGDSLGSWIGWALNGFTPLAEEGKTGLDRVKAASKLPPGPPLPKGEKTAAEKFAKRGVYESDAEEVNVFSPGQGAVLRSKAAQELGKQLHVLFGLSEGIFDDLAKMTWKDAMEIRTEGAIGIGEGIGLALKDPFIGAFKAITDPVGTVVGGVTGLVQAFTHPTEAVQAIAGQAWEFVKNATPRDIGRQYGRIATHIVGAKVTANFSEAIAGSSLGTKIRELFADIGRVGCFIGETPCWVTSPALALVNNADGRNRTEHDFLHRDFVETAVPIKDIPLGQRINAQNPRHSPAGHDWHDTDYTGWKIIDLVVKHASGSLVDVQLLRSEDWIERNGLQIGQAFDLKLTELDLDAQAVVSSITAGPEVLPGPGTVVTGRFVTRQATDLVRVTFDDGTQLIGTKKHPVWSPEYDTWLGLGEFEPGDFVQTRHGRLAVVIVEPLAERPAVYNIEVSGEHVYEVTELGILVHNSAIDCDELLKLRSLELKGKATPKQLTRLGELEDAIQKFDYKGLLGDEAPAWMQNAHVHHILFKKGLGKAQQLLVVEGMEILWKNKINPLTDEANLIWAPNVAGQHTKEALEKVLKVLRKLDAAKASKQKFFDELRKLGGTAAKR